MTISSLPPVLPTAPSSPDPDTVTLVCAVIRALLQLASGLGLAVGTYSDSTVTLIASAIVAIGTVAWSLYQKIRAKQKDHLGSVATATEANRMLSAAGVVGNVRPLTTTMTAA